MKLIIASNRLPYKIIDDKIVQSDGGLSSCLKNINLEFMWVGWLNQKLDNPSIKCISLSYAEEERYYNNFCNKFLWHIFNDDFTKYYEKKDFEFYEKVNMTFAKSIIEIIEKEDDIIWINDYHLFFTAKYLKEIYKIKNKIIYFHHIQIPNNVNQLFASLPPNFMNCMKYYDLISCHTKEYCDRFKQLLSLHKINIPKLLCNPIGINYNYFKKISNTIEKKPKKKFIILGIDRLDFVKGLYNKFEAINVLLRRYPELKNKIQLYQLIIPSRETVNKNLKINLERQISKINGYHTTFETDPPIKYQYNRVNINELVTMYKNSDICLITSFGDGMNLVSLEYCICNPEGCLCLSDKAGSSIYLKGTLQFNPYNLNDIVESIYKAYNLSTNDKLHMMQKNIEFIKENNSNVWANRLINTITKMNNKKIIFCDYDGTLTPIVNNPDDAKPTDLQYKLLKTLCENKNNIIYIISGRSKNTMEKWFGHIDNLILSAEHGEFIKHGQNWINFVNISNIEEKKQKIINMFISKKTSKPLSMSLSETSPVLEKLFIENKSVSVNINFNNCKDLYKSKHVELLKKEIIKLYPEIIIKKGLNCIEFSFSKRNKGNIVKEILCKYNNNIKVYAFGDEQTDEDMFKVLNKENHYTFKVGDGETNAKYRCDNPNTVHEILYSINSDVILEKYYNK